MQPRVCFRCRWTEPYDASFERIRGLPHAYEKIESQPAAILERKACNKLPHPIVLSMINFGLNEESIAIMRKYWESVAGIDEGRIKSFTTWDGNAEAVNCGKSAGWNHSRDFDCCA